MKRKSGIQTSEDMREDLECPVCLKIPMIKHRSALNADELRRTTALVYVDDGRYYA